MQRVNVPQFFAMVTRKYVISEFSSQRYVTLKCSRIYEPGEIANASVYGHWQAVKWRVHRSLHELVATDAEWTLH
jgi:hypothetical protein